VTLIRYQSIGLSERRKKMSEVILSMSTENGGSHSNNDEGNCKGKQVNDVVVEVIKPTAIIDGTSLILCLWAGHRFIADYFNDALLSVTVKCPVVDSISKDEVATIVKEEVADANAKVVKAPVTTASLSGEQSVVEKPTSSSSLGTDSNGNTCSGSTSDKNINDDGNGKKFDDNDSGKDRVRGNGKKRSFEEHSTSSSQSTINNGLHLSSSDTSAVNDVIIHTGNNGKDSKSIDETCSVDKSDKMDTSAEESTKVIGDPVKMMTDDSTTADNTGCMKVDESGDNEASLATIKHAHIENTSGTMDVIEVVQSDVRIDEIITPNDNDNQVNKVTAMKIDEEAKVVEESSTTIATATEPTTKVEDEGKQMMHPSKLKTSHKDDGIDVHEPVNKMAKVNMEYRMNDEWLRSLARHRAESFGLGNRSIVIYHRVVSSLELFVCFFYFTVMNELRCCSRAFANICG
jgi:hypothetical protein